MGYRWLNVKISEQDDDGNRRIIVEGRGELPVADATELAPDDSMTVQTHLEFGDSLSDQPSDVECKKIINGESEDITRD